ncbi:MAG TPA: GntR family transcriptional regulator [Limnochordia bacterium]|nr:GntR family transcriptional regulator [Limnochordia bacterium]
MAGGAPTAETSTEQVRIREADAGTGLPAAGSAAEAASAATATERAYAAIKEAIFARQLRPGMTLSERRLSGLLGVSRTPVRQALLRLQQEGLLTRGAQNAFELIRLTEEDLDEVFEMREWIEGLAARRVADRAGSDPEVAARVRALAAKLCAARADIEGGDFEREFALDLELHDTLLALAGNRRIRETIERMNAQIHQVRILSRARARSQETVAEHLAILAAVGAADPDAAEASMRAHIRRAAATARLLLGATPQGEPQ